MNDKARDLLVQADLNHIPQIRGRLKHGNGFCTLGVLYQHLVEQGLVQWSGTDTHGYVVLKLDGRSLQDHGHVILKDHFDLSTREIGQIIGMNDNECRSFLDIARKVGMNDVDDS